MKKVSYFLVFIFTFLITLTVNAKYKEYNAGEYVVINDHPYLILEDSNSTNSKLKVVDSSSIYVSNGEELYQTCPYTLDFGDGPKNVGGTYYSVIKSGLDNGAGLRYISNYLPSNDFSQANVNYIKCISEHARVCNQKDENCEKLYLPFETRRLDIENEELTYDENSETNIGYFFKNNLDAHYKSRMGLTNVKTKLGTADEHINLIKSLDMATAGRLIINYAQDQNYCREAEFTYDGYNGFVNDSSIQSSIPDGTTIPFYGFFGGDGNNWLNSLKYTKECFSSVGWYSNSEIESFVFYDMSGLQPVIEISKDEFEYKLTTEVEGSGTVELDVPPREFNIGDKVVVKDMIYTIIEKNGNETKLLSNFPVMITNRDEVEEICDVEGTTDTQYYNCLIEHAKYCTKIDPRECMPIKLAYNFDDSTDFSYNPAKTNNVGHYVKNELTEYLKRIFGNNISVDVLTNDGLDTLVEEGIVEKEEAPIAPKKNSNSNNSFIFADYYSFYESIINMNNVSSFNKSPDGYIYPVITVTDLELDLYTRAGNKVKVTTTPAEGYELVELKVTSDGNTITYSPKALTHLGVSNYTFTMPNNDTHVFAKFVTATNKFNAKSITSALLVEEGLNRNPGDKVRFTINLNEDEVLQKIVYYDEDNKEVEIEYQRLDDGYELTMPEKDIYIEAVIKSNSTLYTLSGNEIEIPVNKSKAGEVLTFTLKDTSKTVESITFTNKEGKEISPYYSFKNGVYSVIMPEDDVTVELTYMSEMEIRVPKTGDTINRTFIVLAISLVVVFGCGYILVKNNKRKSYN